MTLGEILEHWIKINEFSGGFEICVAMPEWIGPHETETEWVSVYKIECLSDELKIDGIDFVCKSKLGATGFEKYGITDPDICAGLEKVLDRKKFFKTCDDCGERNHTFHMVGRICNACIPEVPGLVY